MDKYFKEGIKVEIQKEKKEKAFAGFSDEQLCELCNKKYKSKRLLSKHNYSAHKKIKHPCNQCETY